MKISDSSVPNEVPLKLSDEQRLALSMIERNVTSSRSILMTLNLICALLFLTQYSMVFGWQKIRPSASYYIYVQRMAQLAAINIRFDADTANGVSVNLDSSEVQIMRVATMHVSSILGRPIKDVVSSLPPASDAGTYLRESLRATLDTLATWRKEELIQQFRADTDSIFETRRQIPFSAEHKEFRYRLAIAEAFREIRDRAEVNMDTKAQALHPRTTVLPLVNMTVQLEDLQVPAALILLFFMSWLHSSAKNTSEAIRVAEECFSGSQEKRTMVMWAANAFYHLRWYPRGTARKPRCLLFQDRVIFLLMTPYMIVMGMILANVYEYAIMDPRIHGKDFGWVLQHSTTTQGFIFILAILLVVALLLVRFTWRIMKGFRKTHYYWSRHVGDKLAMSKPKMKPVFFVMVALIPLVIFAPYVMLMNGKYGETEYFLDATRLAIFLGVLFIYFLSLWLVQSSTSLKRTVHSVERLWHS